MVDGLRMNDNPFINTSSIRHLSKSTMWQITDWRIVTARRVTDNTVNGYQLTIVTIGRETYHIRSLQHLSPYSVHINHDEARIMPKLSQSFEIEDEQNLSLERGFCWIQ